jgi:putative ABC transport system substrate-binding protein
MQFDQLNRREFITLLGGAAPAWPLAARAQQPIPVIGFIDSRPSDAMSDRLRAFRQGLKDIGYVERENVAIEYRWAENQMDRLPELAAELVRRQVTVIAAPTAASALAAKGLTTTIPIVFLAPEDPVRFGLVVSLARPGGNLTGINLLTGELSAKRLEILRETVPGAARVAVLVNPTNPATETTVRDWKLLPAPWGCKSRCSTPTLATISTPLSKPWRARGPKPFSSRPLLSLLGGASNWSNWRRNARSPRLMGRVNMSKPVG